MFDDISSELEKCKLAFTKASQSNVELHKAMDLHIQNLKLLSSPLDDIKAALPNPKSALCKSGVTLLPKYPKIGKYMKHLLLLRVIDGSVIEPLY